MSLVVAFLFGFAVASLVFAIGLTIACCKLVKKLEVKKDDIYANNSVGNPTKRNQ